MLYKEAMSKKTAISNVGENIKVGNTNWSFKGSVSETFSSHIRKSVPLYDEGHDIICKISDYFIKNDSICYDIGTSVGELLLKLSKHHVHKESVKWIGIDCEEDMIKKAHKDGKKYNNISFEVADIINYDFEKSDLIISYYTIQFIPPKFRQLLINKIYESLNWGGAFLYFEKVRAPDARFQDMMTTLYNDYKLDQNYNPAEIIAKTRSLKGVLEPFSTQGNIDLLKRAEFKDIMSVMKYVCFEGFLAIK